MSVEYEIIDAEKAVIEAVFAAAPETCAHRRIHAAPPCSGEEASLEPVRRLMVVGWAMAERFKTSPIPTVPDFAAGSIPIEKVANSTAIAGRTRPAMSSPAPDREVQDWACPHSATRIRL